MRNYAVESGMERGREKWERVKKEKKGEKILERVSLARGEEGSSLVSSCFHCVSHLSHRVSSCTFFIQESRWRSPFDIFCLDALALA